MTDRHMCHLAAVRRVIRRLRRRHFRVRRLEPAQPGGVELKINGLSVAVRVATVALRQKRIHTGGRLYVYHYAAASWCLHQHCRRKAHPDVWLFVADRDVYVVPAAVIGERKTLTLLGGEPKRERPSRIRAFLERWDVLRYRRKAVAA